MTGTLRTLMFHMYTSALTFFFFFFFFFFQREYNFSKLPWGAAVIFGYNGIVPLILWGVLIWVDDFDISLPQMWCLYGYSMFIFIPAAVRITC